MPMLLSRNRRRDRRWPVQVLARCTTLRGGRRVESNMWVRDVNESGLRLESLDASSGGGDAAAFRRGRKISVRHLFYDEKGAREVAGTLRWAFQDPETERWRVGVRLAGGRSPSSFRDFLGVVKSSR